MNWATASARADLAEYVALFGAHSLTPAYVSSLLDGVDAVMKSSLHPVPAVVRDLDHEKNVELAKSYNDEFNNREVPDSSYPPLPVIPRSFEPIQRRTEPSRFPVPEQYFDGENLSEQKPKRRVTVEDIIAGLPELWRKLKGQK